MKKYCFLIAALATAAFLSNVKDADAQVASRADEAFRMIAENPDRAANNMHSYEFKPLVDTRTPKGYKAFYISHYGRHGSRYEQSASFSRAALQGFRKADSLNLLSPAGKDLYAQVQTITDEHEGMEGALSPRGGREHQTLATRMARRYPTVFNQKDRKEVSSFSSTVQRCIISMANFTSALKGENSDLQFTFTTGQRYMNYLSPSIRMSRGAFSGRGQAPQEQYDWSRFFSIVFSNPAATSEIIPDREGFVRSVYSAGGLCQDLDFLGFDIFRTYFTPEELTYLWKRQNDMIYLMWGNSLENGDNVRETLKPLLKDFVDKADAALASGSHRCADLRFGHDTGVLPLAALLGIDDPDGNRFSMNDAHDYWFSFERVPMGTNLQMIFYRNKKGNVLTKVLYNEQEAHFKDVKPVEGPYYNWKDLREWFLSLCD
ncbi:MAG: histidine-type phosphatase [Bacteroidales bacterium]|nr:histidine-type phosphatase [Bacteroidales bacterium]